MFCNACLSEKTDWRAMDEESGLAKAVEIYVYAGPKKAVISCPEKRTRGLFLSGIQVVFFKQGVKVGPGQA